MRGTDLPTDLPDLLAPSSVEKWALRHMSSAICCHGIVHAMALPMSYFIEPMMITSCQLKRRALN